MLIVIPCGARKQAVPAAAADLYTGPYYRACLAWARARVPDDQIRILSALHGLVPLDRQLDPYNLTLGQPGAITPEQVRRQALRMGLLDEQVIALGGRSYTGICQAIWPGCERPLAGVGGMGRQLSWLTQTRLEAGA